MLFYFDLDLILFYPSFIVFCYDLDINLFDCDLILF